jgi:biotin operon repressor
MPLSFATTHDLERLEARLNRRINRMADATQADIDNLTSQVQQVATDLDSSRSKLQAEIDSLAAQGVDVTSLQEAVAPLDSAVQALGDLQPTPPPAA